MDVCVALRFDVTIWVNVTLLSAPMACEVLVETVGSLGPTSGLFGAALVAIFISLMEADSDVL